jgi:hypothetical protein
MNVERAARIETAPLHLPLTVIARQPKSYTDIRFRLGLILTCAITFRETRKDFMERRMAPELLPVALDNKK